MKIGYIKEVRIHSDVEEHQDQSQYRLTEHQRASEQRSVEEYFEKLRKDSESKINKRNFFDQEPNKDWYVHLAMMQNVCPHCAAKHYYDQRIVYSKDIRFSKRCNSGKFVFLPLRDPPDLIKAFPTGQFSLER